MNNTEKNTQAWPSEPLISPLLPPSPAWGPHRPHSGLPLPTLALPPSRNSVSPLGGALPTPFLVTVVPIPATSPALGATPLLAQEGRGGGLGPGALWTQGRTQRLQW